MAIKKIKDSNGVEHELQTTIANVDGLQEELNKRTDSKLYQYYTLTESDAEYPIIYSYTTDTGTTSYKSTYGAVKAGFTFNPSTDTLHIGDGMSINSGSGISHQSVLTIQAGDDLYLYGHNMATGIELSNSSIDIEGTQLYLRGETYVTAPGHIDLSAGQDTGTYITLDAVNEDDRRIDINSDKIYLSANNETDIWGTNRVAIYAGENDEAYIDVRIEDGSGVGIIDINAETTTFYGSTIAFNSLQIGKYDHDVDNIDFMFNGGDAGMFMSYDSDGNSIVDIYGDKVTINGNPIGSSLEIGTIKINGDESKIESVDSPNHYIYLGDDSIDINGQQINLLADISVTALTSMSFELASENSTQTYIRLMEDERDDRNNGVKISSNFDMNLLAQQGSINLKSGTISLDTESAGHIELNADTISLAAATIFIQGQAIEDYIGSLGGGGSSDGTSRGKRRVTLQGLRDYLVSECSGGERIQVYPREFMDVSFFETGLCLVVYDIEGSGNYSASTTKVRFTEGASNSANVYQSRIFIDQEYAYIKVDLFTLTSSGTGFEEEYDGYELDDHNCEFYLLD